MTSVDIKPVTARTSAAPRALSLMVIGNTGESEMLGALGEGVRLRRYDASVADDEFDTVDAVVLDTRQFEQLAHRTVIDKALAAGTPVVLLHNEAAGSVASAIGIGLRSEALLVKPVEGTRELWIADLGNGASLLDASWGSDSRATGPANDRSAEPAGSVATAATGQRNLATAMPRTPATTARRLQDELRTRHLSAAQQRVVHAAREERSAEKVPPEVPQRIYYLETETQWYPDEVQQAILGVTWHIELYGSSNPPNKFLRITPRGYGAFPGQLVKDDNFERGWFQEKITIEMRADENHRSKVSILEHSPPNTNNVTTLESATAFDIGFSQADGASASFSASQSVTTQLQDFRVENRSTPDHAMWENSLSLVGGDRVYKNWDDLVKIYFPIWGAIQLLELPPLAKQLFSHNCQTVWIASNELKEQIPFGLMAWQTLRDTFVKTGFSIEWSSYFRTYGIGYALTGQNPNPLLVDFGLV
ncbi:MAG: hypothetical protein ACOZJX_17170 [Pseudomonadota bacterium]